MTVADGSHSQLLELNTKGVVSPDNDRYSGIYQTVRVMDWAEYTLNLSGMIRTTNMAGDPWRYRVQVGWTEGGQSNWGAVKNWTDVGWDNYYERTSPGSSCGSSLPPPSLVPRYGDPRPPREGGG